MRHLGWALAFVFVVSSCGPRAQMPPEQRRECRRLRAQTAMAGVGLTVGLVVVATAVIVVAAATRGRVGSGRSRSGSSAGSRRRSARRAHRRAVCRELPYAAPSVEPGDQTVAAPSVDSTVSNAVATGSVATASGANDAVATTSVDPAVSGGTETSTGRPPSDARLTEVLGMLDRDLRGCFTSPEGLVELDLAIDGDTGRVARFDVLEVEASEAERACVGRQLARARFEPFDGELRVTTKLDLAWLPPPPP
ncbi:MAG: hypothetical protein H6721_14765 [Sandaracinus sp.]|nr:hypothetical protein [Sandaracinus sp.]MCB9633374.1 hypothetical protein [Sandaracinus sp.]